MFRSVRFYSVSSPWPDSEQTLSERLAAAVFKPCGSLHRAQLRLRTAGRLRLAVRWRAASRARISLRLRNQVRLLPTAAVNEALEVRLAEYRERMQEEPGRRTKRKLKEQTRDELLPKALLKSDRTTALYPRERKRARRRHGIRSLAPSVSSSCSAAALGKLDAEPLEVRAARRARARAACSPATRRRSSRWGASARMRDRADAKSSVRWSEVDLTHANVRRCVKDGMELTHLGFEFGGAHAAACSTRKARSAS